MPNSKQPWDTRAWLVGIVGGFLSAVLHATSVSPAIATRLDAALTGGAIWMHGVSGAVSVFLLPALLSGLAKRWHFLWGLLPLALVEIGDEWQQGWPSIHNDAFLFSLLALCVCWLLTSGPVSLVRWLRVRAVRRHAALLASYAAMQNAAAEPQEGVWPPPPNRSVL